IHTSCGYRGAPEPIGKLCEPGGREWLIRRGLNRVGTVGQPLGSSSKMVGNVSPTCFTRSDVAHDPHHWQTVSRPGLEVILVCIDVKTPIANVRLAALDLNKDQVAARLPLVCHEFNCSIDAEVRSLEGTEHAASPEHESPHQGNALLAGLGGLRVLCGHIFLAMVVLS